MAIKERFSSLREQFVRTGVRRHQCCLWSSVHLGLWPLCSASAKNSYHSTLRDPQAPHPLVDVECSTIRVGTWVSLPLSGSGFLIFSWLQLIQSKKTRGRLTKEGTQRRDRAAWFSASSACHRNSNNIQSWHCSQLILLARLSAHSGGENTPKCTSEELLHLLLLN